MGNGLALLEKTPVTIKGETYTIANVPDGSKLVLAVKSRILAEMKLNDLLTKLQLVGKLLFVAYNGVATQPKLRGKVSTLQTNYMKLCADSYEAMVAFDDYCTKMLSHLRSLFTYLLGGKEDTALLYLARMGQVADEMARTATELATGFQQVFLQAVEAQADAEVAKGTEEEQREALEEKRADFEALSAKAKTLVEEIAKSKVKLQQLYDEAKAAAEKSEGRAFTLELVGAIFGGIGQAVGGVASTVIAMKMPPRLDAIVPTNPPPKQKPKAGKEADAVKVKAKEAEDAAKEAKTKAGELKDIAALAKTTAETEEEKWKKLRAKQKDAQRVVADLNKEKKPDAKKIRPAEEKAEEAKTKAKEAKTKFEEAKKKFDEAKKKADEAEEKDKEAAEKHRLLAAGLKGLGEAMEGVGDRVGEMGRGYAAIAAEYNQEKRELLKRLLDQGEQERAALASIKEYAIRMQNLKADKNLADLVIEALHQAIGALKQIVVILSNAADLWKRMARHCKNLADGAGGMKEMIAIWKTDPDRLELYQGEDFVVAAVTHYADWKALQMISQEYSVEANKVKLEVQVNLQRNITTQEMLALAIKEGKVLLASANDGLANLDNEVRALRGALEATPSSNAVATA
jgi:chemotaxis protein histidine kinase CheA